MTVDFPLVSGDLQLDLGLKTAVFVSLFTDARRPDTGIERNPDEDPRGWCGDRDGDSIGSLLWTLEREKVTPATIDRARQYAEECLSWMVDDGIAESIVVVAERGDLQQINLQVTITRSRDTRWSTLWAGVANEGATNGRFELRILVR